MRIVYFGNNRLGWMVLDWLREQGAEIAGLVLHPPARRRFGDEIERAAALAPDRIFDGSRLREPDVLDRIGSLRADLGLSVMFGYILRAPLIGLFPRGVVNLHPSLLPFNRGACPNVWSIVDGTPAGATLHYIDTRVDTGDLIAQQKVEVEPVDTGLTLYGKLETAAFDLFRRAWPAVLSGVAAHVPQPAGAGTSHRMRDLDGIAEIDLDRQYTGRELIDILRARSFPPYPGAYFRAADGRRVNLRLELEYSHESNDHD